MDLAGEQMCSQSWQPRVLCHLYQTVALVSNQSVCHEASSKPPYNGLVSYNNHTKAYPVSDDLHHYY